MTQQHTEETAEFNPGEAVFPTMTAQEALNETLTNLMERAEEEYGRQGNYPTDEDLAVLAPSLKGLVMKEIREQQLAPCNHAFGDLANLARDVVDGLPEAEMKALMERMKPTPNG